MQCLKANTLNTATHRVVQVGELPDTSKSANNILVKCPLSNRIFDCWVISDNVRKDCAHANHGHYFVDHDILPISIFHLQCVLWVWQHNNMWVVIECHQQQWFQFVADCQISLLFGCECSVNSHLSSAEKSAFLDHVFVDTINGAWYNAKSLSMITPAWIACLPHWQWSIKGKHSSETRFSPIVNISITGRYLIPT